MYQWETNNYMDLNRKKITNKLTTPTLGATNVSDPG
jgi:hypothetical protein